MFAIVKLFGVCMVVGGAAVIGFSEGGKLTLRVRILEELIQVFEGIRNEVLFSSLPIGQVIEGISAKRSGVVAQFLAGIVSAPQESFSERYLFSLEAHARELLLDKESFLRLCEVRHYLGKYELSEQDRSLTKTLEALEACLLRAQTERGSKGKLYRTLGVSAGIMSVILLL